MNLSIGFSPCPNDTFIFDALVNNKIDTGGIHFVPQLEDVQTLNEWARQGKLDITKLSYGVLPKVLDQYTLLSSGGALGKGVGPLLISKHAWDTSNWPQIEEQVNAAIIAIPGADTTAHFLFSQAFPNANNKIFIRFDQIQDFVLAGKGPGVIIHENRFTYQDKGLHKITDLGDYWEKTTGNPIPLGGIVMKTSFGDGLLNQVNGLIRKSLEYAFANYPALPPYVRAHSQEMEETVMRQHIDLYVNNYSLDLGEDGRNAVHTLMQVFKKMQAAAV